MEKAPKGKQKINRLFAGTGRGKRCSRNFLRKTGWLLLYQRPQPF